MKGPLKNSLSLKNKKLYFIIGFLIVIFLIFITTIIIVFVGEKKKTKIDKPDSEPASIFKEYGDNCWIPERREFGFCGIDNMDIERLFITTKNNGLTCSNELKICSSPAHKYIGIKPDTTGNSYVITN